MPPLVRPTSPRSPCRRVANTNCRSAAPAAKPARPNASSGANPSPPSRTASASVPAPHHAGQNNRSRSNSPLALRHGNAGATAIKNSSTRPIGRLIVSKNGEPTAILRSSFASTMSGKTVPSSTTKANRANTALFARNAPSRETAESIAPGERSWSPRQAMSANETATMTPNAPSRYGPIVPSLKACTLLITPLRVRKVPRMVSENVATNRLRFHTRNIPRRSCTITEWIYAVPVSQGRKLAFSTGSQPHTPPQPSTS